MNMREIPITSMIGVTEKNIKVNYPIFYNSIVNLHYDEDISISEKIWLYKNEMSSVPVCINCGIEKLKFWNFSKGYRKFCSKKCSAEYSHKDPIIKEKRIKNMILCNHDSVIRESMTKKANDTKKLFSDEKKLKIKNKRLLCVNEKYGVNIISQNKEIIEKIKKTIIITKHKNKDFNFSERIKNMDYEFISCEKNNLKLKYNICGHNFDIHRSLFNQRNRFNVTICTICNPISNHISDFQNKIKQFISSIYSGEIIDNKKINKYEIDIFLPELNFGVECNGLWWHSELYREKEYHINKINYFNDKNIKIINIWEDWWKIKPDIVKSILSNKINKTENIIYGRKTEIIEIKNEKIIKDFLDKNHIQGYVHSKVKIGLYYNKELVSLMTFGKRRIALGKKLSKDNEWELIRFCNKLNTRIIGGASKIFNYFIKRYEFDTITTYADLSISDGDLYNKLKMRCVSITEPNYSYFHKDIGVRMNRFNYRKDILIKQGYDENKTEKEIMKDRNYYRIYDCGNLKFEYKKIPD